MHEPGAWQRRASGVLSSSQATRRCREFERLAEIVKVLGIELLTTAAAYAGNRKAVLYRKPGVAEVQSAPAYRLRIWATNAREQVA